MEKTLEELWLSSNEYVHIHKYTELLIESCEQLNYTPLKSAKILKSKQLLDSNIKKAWLERNQTGGQSL